MNSLLSPTDFPSGATDIFIIHPVHFTIHPSFVSRPCGTKNNHNPSFVPDCISSSYSCMELHDIVLYYNYILIVTNFSDTIVVILSDWSDTGVEPGENMKNWLLDA